MLSLLEILSKFDTKNIDKLDKQTIVIYRNYSSKRAKENLLIEMSFVISEVVIKFM